MPVPVPEPEVLLTSKVPPLIVVVTTVRVIPGEQERTASAVSKITCCRSAPVGDRRANRCCSAAVDCKGVVIAITRQVQYRKAPY